MSDAKIDLALQLLRAVGEKVDVLDSKVDALTGRQVALETACTFKHERVNELLDGHTGELSGLTAKAQDSRTERAADKAKIQGIWGTLLKVAGLLTAGAGIALGVAKLVS